MSIQEKRLSKNLTQTQIAEELGITRSTVAMWESGQSLPRAELLPKLARILGCTIDQLLADEIEAENRRYQSEQEREGM